MIQPVKTPSICIEGTRISVAVIRERQPISVLKTSVFMAPIPRRKECVRLLIRLIKINGRKEEANVTA